MFVAVIFALIAAFVAGQSGCTDDLACETRRGSGFFVAVQSGAGDCYNRCLSLESITAQNATCGLCAVPESCVETCESTVTPAGYSVAVFRGRRQVSCEDYCVPPERLPNVLNQPRASCGTCETVEVPDSCPAEFECVTERSNEAGYTVHATRRGRGCVSRCIPQANIVSALSVGAECGECPSSCGDSPETCDLDGEVGYMLRMTRRRLCVDECVPESALQLIGRPFIECGSCVNESTGPGAELLARQFSRAIESLE